MRRSSTKRISAAVRQQADGWQLGPLQRTYILGGMAGLVCVLGLSCLLFGAALLAAFFYLYHDIFSWWSFWLTLLIPALGGCWLLLGLWVTFSYLLTRPERVYVFAKGIIYQRKRAFQVARWNQAERLWRRGSDGDEPPSFVLQFHEGIRVVLPGDLPGIQALYRFIEDLVTRRVVTSGLADYQAGKVLHFGALEMSRYGLVVKNDQRTLSWSDFTRLTDDQASLRIYYSHDDDPWTVLDGAEVYNRKACMALAEQISELSRQQLQRESFYHEIQQLPQVAEFEQGTTVSFGSLRMSKQGIEMPNGVGMLPWCEIACIGVAENALIIRRQGMEYEWHAVPAWTITDTPALKELVTYIVNQRTS
ncbi:MAG: hypothetical protein J2P37_24100 [Ktedonobacteraceae bacterium]|nr:hypothetical protein [Ktedonobacteraceae bacterium]MBO0789867.1 hypothetical protein [Ktedonobacteraceae bacterium]